MSRRSPRKPADALLCLLGIGFALQRGMKKKALFTLTMLCLMTGFAKVGEAQTRRGAFVHSAIGPGSSKTAVNIGVRAYTPEVRNLDTVIPTVDLNVVHGINRTLDYELRVSTIGFLSLIDTGVKMRLVGSEAFSIGARLDASGLLAILPEDDGTEVAGLFGVTPGVIVSTGGPRFQLSAGLDVPILLGTASEVGGVRATGDDTAFGYLLRPWIGVEVPIGRTVSMTAQAQAYVSPTHGDVAPNVALGISF